MRQKLLKDGAQIRKITSLIKHFEQAHTAANFESVRLGQFPCIVVVEQNGIGEKFFGKKDCAEFSRPKRDPLLGREQALSIPKPLHMNPIRISDLRCSRQPRTSDHYFVMDLSRNINSWKKLVEEVETAEFSQNNQRRGICNDYHTSSRSVDRRSSSRSSKV